MPLPEFNEHGDLPAGLHVATLDDVLTRFGKSTAQRVAVAQRLTRIHRFAMATGHVRRFVVFGSFVTVKPEPNDVDIFLVMDDEFDYSAAQGETRLLFEHGTAQSHFGASLFWLRQLAAYNGEDAAIADWQIKRDILSTTSKICSQAINFLIRVCNRKSPCYSWVASMLSGSIEAMIWVRCLHRPQ